MWVAALPQWSVAVKVNWNAPEVNAEVVCNSTFNKSYPYIIINMS